MKHVILLLLLAMVVALPVSAQKPAYTSSNKNAIGLYKKGMQCLYRSDKKGAENMFKAATKADSKFVEPNIMLAEMYEEEDQYSLAAMYYQAAVDAQPRFYTIAWFRLGECHLRLKHYNEAVSAFQQFLTLDKNKDKHAVVEEKIKLILDKKYADAENMGKKLTKSTNINTTVVSGSASDKGSTVNSTDSKSVDITVSGSGPDKETAVKIALRSALEQTYGTFVSTSTQIKNDKLMSDEIVSLSRGNIKNYKILSEEQMPNGHWHVLLHATVNINQLVNYVHGSGSSVSVDMNAFNAKVLMEELNRAAERKIIDNLIAEIEAVDLWDYSIELDEPSVNGDKYVISGVVQVKYNANTCAVVKLMVDVFSALDMSNKKEDKINGINWYKYGAGNTSNQQLPNNVHPTLRNKYNNGLLTSNDRGDICGFKPDVYQYIFNSHRPESPFLKKIRFVIEPLNIKVNNCKVETTVYTSEIRYSGDGYYLKLTHSEFNNVLSNHGKAYKTNDVVFNLHFKKEVSREEAIKIKKITVRPL